MTDFCLKILNENPPYDEVKMLTQISNYANFLKQPLILEMFVPCDENGNVLEQPRMIARTIEFDEQDVFWDVDEVEAYRAAKEKVLFEGFMNVDTRKEGQIYFALKQSHRKNNIDYIMNDSFGLFFYNSSNERQRVNVVEDLLNFHELILSESALKKIGAEFVAL